MEISRGDAVVRLVPSAPCAVGGTNGDLHTLLSCFAALLEVEELTPGARRTTYVGEVGDSQAQAIMLPRALFR